jgi:hypothetical protein
LALTVLETIARLHQLNVLLGDVNPHNVLIAE